ncbi:MAG: SDR family NAD(P)-dependent oxidoreductase [Gemmatimonadetes bacterium]|nr:SDR family NAD(P)-dependent oxidoreductase [Gemmatimonadota bacterium]
MGHYLVTGAVGFIGSRVASLLLERGDRVTGVDNRNDAYDVRLKDWRLERLRHHPAFRFIEADIADRAAVAALFADGARFDAVLNLAARAGVRPSVENPWIYYEANTTGTLNLLDACVRSGIGKFVLASTSSLYGQHNPRPYAEAADTDRPLSPYAASKKAAETLAWTYHYLNGVDVTILRYFTVYGPAGRPDMSLFRFVQWIREGRPVKVFGDGRQERDFTFVDDVARATVAGLAPLGYEIINVGSDQPVVLMDAIRLVEEFTGRSARIDFGPRHPADVLATWARIDVARRLLGWQPDTPFREGVRRCVEWYEENRAWAADVRTGE